MATASKPNAAICFFMTVVLLVVVPVRFESMHSASRDHDRMRHKLGAHDDFRMTDMGHCGDNAVQKQTAIHGGPFCAIQK